MTSNPVTVIQPLILFSVLFFTGCTSLRPPKVTSTDQLPKHDQRVRLSGTYYDPGKGGDFLDCGFAKFDFRDHSHYKRSTKGKLKSRIKNGDQVELNATIYYFPGSVIPVDEYPIIQSRLPEPTVVDGVEVYETPPNYSIGNVWIISRKPGN